MRERSIPCRQITNWAVRRICGEGSIKLPNWARQALSDELFRPNALFRAVDMELLIPSGAVARKDSTPLSGVKSRPIQTVSPARFCRGRRRRRRVDRCCLCLWDSACRVLIHVANFLVVAAAERQFVTRCQNPPHQYRPIKIGC